MSDKRHATIDIWQEPNGYWSASVIVRIPGLDDWKASATSFHNAPEARDWAWQQVELAVLSA